MLTTRPERALFEIFKVDQRRRALVRGRAWSVGAFGPPVARAVADVGAKVARRRNQNAREVL
ncbi:MAG TPA: hypothetical protein VHZ95_12000, partial [Polyangiales bacterium]|nr:hypothetical protein [Polyangiales bacterium]